MNQNNQNNQSNQSNQSKSISIKQLAEQYDGFKHGDIRDYIADAYTNEFIEEHVKAIIDRLRNRK